jgi:O-antigen/teichoic acid export membrane protein
VALGTARSAFLMPTGRMRFHLAASALGSGANVALNAILIPRMGALGAAIASLVSYSVVALWSCFLYPPLFRTGWMLLKALVWPRP